MLKEQTTQSNEIHETVKAILAQTKMTNGRVSKLEVWRGYVTGGLSILALLVAPVLIYIVTHW